MRRPSLFSLIRRGWMVAVTVVVICVAAFAISRLHGIFGSGDTTSTSSDSADEIVPFNPKDVVYEVFGAPGASGATATINYLDVNAAPQQVVDAPLPWRYQATTTEPAVIADLRAQGDGATLGCRIFIDGELKDERVVYTVSAYTFCLDKSG